jgi:hypothetical protein
MNEPKGHSMRTKIVLGLVSLAIFGGVVFPDFDLWDLYCWWIGC